DGPEDRPVDEEPGKHLFFGWRFLLLLFGGGLRLRDPHRRAGAELHHAVDDHALAFLQAVGDDPVAAAGPFAGLHRPRLGRALLVDDIDELALRALEHRAL